MAKLDFWWDEDDVRPSPNFDALLTVVQARRPALKAPTIAVIGSFKHFLGSALQKAASRTKLIRIVDFNELSDSDISSPQTALLRWSPRAGHLISSRHMARIPPSVRVLNGSDLDTTKPNVEAVFARVAGYDVRLDPRVDEGYAVIKSNMNGAHDGRIVKLPLAVAEADTVCERLIANTIADHIFDIRVPFVLGHPILGYVKFRERGRRFENSNACVKLVAPPEVLTDDEIDICRRYCGAAGLDYGELDILRDGDKGKIYVVDVNNTPAGPPKGLSESDRATALRLIAVALRQHLFNLAC